MHRNLDIIGDVHGRAKALRELLATLSYRLVGGVYIHPEGRIAIFTGDFVDGGSQNLEVVEIVRAMVAHGSALAVMGNHDFNIVAFNRLDPERPGEFLRSHSERHRHQCEATQREIEANPERASILLEFLGSLPLWLDLPEVRIVHACWDTAAMAELLPLTSRNALNHRTFAEAARLSGSFGDARSMLLSGPEIETEPYQDRSGHIRTMDRVSWWLDHTDDDPRPIFFGHYALAAPLSTFDKAVCVDAGIAKGGPIAAYSHSLGTPLSPDNFVYVDG